ncbi:hypothetical protein [Halorussus marinus]|uniref:hypothetical protein n=1 Tax=Halorussus marinus TaxID=2505976 RepID=UPI001092B045|nr:hypothetical protein [Halorussus marinus]
MATDDTSRLGWAFRLLFLVLVVVPVAVPFADAVEALPVALDTALLARLTGAGAVLAVLAVLVTQKRRARGREVTDSPEHRRDREPEGTGEVYAPYAYNNQQRARREGERIRERAAEVAEADREGRDRP